MPSERLGGIVLTPRIVVVGWPRGSRIGHFSGSDVRRRSQRAALAVRPQAARPPTAALAAVPVPTQRAGRAHRPVATNHGCPGDGFSTPSTAAPIQLHILAYQWSYPSVCRPVQYLTARCEGRVKASRSNGEPGSPTLRQSISPHGGLGVCDIRRDAKPSQQQT